MADKEVAIKINVDADGGAKSLSELKKEFKETQKTLEGLTIGTKEYVNTLQRLGGIKDDIGDLNDTIKTFNPEGKIQAFGNVMGGVASGIQGAVGAMALFGVESEETQKMLLKVQAASAFADGIKGVIGLGDSFKNLQLVLGKTALGQKLVTAGQWLWNAAMTANPIGLIIAGIAALVGAFALLSSSSEDAAADQARLNELEKKAAEEVDKYVAAIEKKNAVLNKASDFEIQLLKAKGATEEELLEAEKKRDEKRRLQLMYLKGFRGDLSAAESAELLALTQKQTLASAKIIGDAKKEEIANKKKYAEEQKKIDDKELEESKARAAEARKDLEELHNVRKGFAQLEEQDRLEKQAKADEDVEAETQKILSRLASRNELIQFQNDQTYAGQLENLQIQMDAELALVEGNEAAKELIRIKYAEKEKDLRLGQAAAAVELAQKTNESLQGLADLYFSIKMANVKKGSAEEEKAARQQFKVNKGLALTGAILSTAMAAIKSLSQAPLAIGPVPSPIGIASLAATILTGAASVAKIAATQYNSTSGGGGGGATASLSSAGGGVALAPPSSGSTQLNADGTIKAAIGNNQPVVKAVVVETDITTSQKRVNTIEERASL